MDAIVFLQEGWDNERTMRLATEKERDEYKRLAETMQAPVAEVEEHDISVTLDWPIAAIIVLAAAGAAFAGGLAL